MGRSIESIQRKYKYNKIWVKNNMERKKAINLKWRKRNRKKTNLRNLIRHKKFSEMFQMGKKKRALKKRCSICKQIKPGKLFYLSNTNNDGLHGWCKECSDKRTVENGRKRLYGISPEQFNEKLRIQKGTCAICYKKPSKKDRALNLDHSHITGKVRGILCSKCNLLLGISGENINILMNAIKYLKTWS